MLVLCPLKLLTPPAALPHSSSGPPRRAAGGPPGRPHAVLLQLGAGWAAAWGMTGMLVEAAAGAPAAGGAGAGAAGDGGPGQGAAVAVEGLGHPGWGGVLQLGCYTVRAPARVRLRDCELLCSLVGCCCTGYPVGLSLAGICFWGRRCEGRKKLHAGSCWAELVP